MQIKSEELLNDLILRTEKATQSALKFKQLSIEQLNYKASAESWSILECLEHLNLYGDFYLVEIEKRILAASVGNISPIFKSGWLGNYFANSMLPQNGKVKNKMKTFKDKNPINSQLSITTLDRFIKQQERMLVLLNQARKVDLTRTRTSITLAQWITLRLGDTFRFVIYHIERHILQAERVLPSDTIPANKKNGISVSL